MSEVSEDGVDAATVAGGDGMACMAVSVALGIGYVSGTTFTGIGNSPVCNTGAFADDTDVVSIAVILYGLCSADTGCSISSDYLEDDYGYVPSTTVGTGPDVVTTDDIDFGSKVNTSRSVHPAGGAKNSPVLKPCGMSIAISVDGLIYITMNSDPCMATVGNRG